MKKIVVNRSICWQKRPMPHPPMQSILSDRRVIMHGFRVFLTMHDFRPPCTVHLKKPLACSNNLQLLQYKYIVVIALLSPTDFSISTSSCKSPDLYPAHPKHCSPLSPCRNPTYRIPFTGASLKSIMSGPTGFEPKLTIRGCI